MQLRDLNRGTFGFVQLALDTKTGLRVAIKFIERGDKVIKKPRTCSGIVGSLPSGVVSAKPSF